MLVAYLAVGYPLEQFWSSTFREVNLHMRAAQVREDHAHNARMALAHATAVLSRRERIPSLSTLLVGASREAADKRTREQERASWRAFALANGVSAQQWSAAEAAARARRAS